MDNHTILWRSLEWPGHEAARLESHGSSWRLSGTAVFAEDHDPCRLDYQIVCDSGWRTLGASVAGWAGIENIDIRISVDPERRWWVNGVENPEVAGCIDIDLNFSPSTNLLPIRRFNLATGESAGLTAAWLRFPGFHLEPLSQVYRRTGETIYRFESSGGAFVRDLQVNQAGFVIHYPDFWIAENPPTG
ncbi:MAG: hypothetical protein EHM70_02705 [Chloroflexota bacterium]|nr:MAG: hypothetical protein EHM70_02705 [Chloroflexota bacterium]